MTNHDTHDEDQVSTSDAYDYFKSEPFPIDDKNFPKFMAGVYDRVVRQGMHSLFLCKNGVDKQGDITTEDIDGVQAFPYIRTVSVSGLKQHTFEYFVRRYGHQFKAIRFCNCHRVEDWSLLGTLPKLEYLYWEGNKCVSTLWDMRGNKFLRGLGLSRITGLHDLKGIASAPALKYFYIDDMDRETGKRSTVAYLTSLEGLATSCLQEVVIDVRKVQDTCPDFVDKMPYLRTLQFPPELFSAMQVAWMIANFPRLTGQSLCPMIETTVASGERTLPAVRMVGKGRPTLVREGNEQRIRQYRKKFLAMVEMFRDVPYDMALKLDQT